MFPHERKDKVSNTEVSKTEKRVFHRRSFWSERPSRLNPVKVPFPRGRADSSSRPSPFLFDRSEWMWRCVVTAPCVYNELAGNRRVFTLDLIVSTPALLLLTVFRACLSAAAGCFKVCGGCLCVCVCGEGVDRLVSLALFVPETRLKGRKSFKWSVSSHTNVALICGAIWPLFALVEALICSLVQRFWWEAVERFGLKKKKCCFL